MNNEIYVDDMIRVPLLALRGLVVFPGMILHFDVGRKKSIEALNEAMKSGQLIFLAAQKDLRNDEPSPEDIYETGAVAKVKQLLHLQGSAMRVLVEGVCRGKYTDIIRQEPFFEATVKRINDMEPKDTALNEALIRKAQELIESYAEFGTHLPQDVYTEIMSQDSAGKLADYIASNILVKFEDKQAVIEELNPEKRLEITVRILGREVAIAKLEHELGEKVHDEIDKNQRDYFIREQIKALSNELGDGDNPLEEAQEYHRRIDKLHLNGESEQKLHEQADRLMKMPYGSHEATVVRGWLDACLALPWNKKTKDKADVSSAKKILDREHYGLDKVKDRILEFIAVKQMSSDIRGQIICLEGPPGVGKTSIARSIAKCMGRKFVRVSLGGIRDEADIRGHRKTYIGAMPGRIMNAIQMSGVSNPLVLLDEIDKLEGDFRGDPASALLEVLDAEQNFAFRDHYLEIPFDLSDVMFITTANTLDTIPTPLLDRMEVLSIASYTREEKFNIAGRHLLPKQLKRHGLNKRRLKITDGALYGLIDYYTREAGVRQLERQIAGLCRKGARELIDGGSQAVAIKEKDLARLLGPKRFRVESIPAKDQIGVVTGLAWTSVGGETMPIEVCVMNGTGKLELTGSLGDVMKESARAAISCIRSRSGELGIDEEFYQKKDIHIHVPEGAIPKDGPSAGVTMATAVVSALLGLPVRRDIAMTGEITLRGRVLPIGGLKEKTMAAYRAGVKTVLIPEENEPDLYDVDKIVKDNIEFIPASDVDTVLKTAILFPPAGTQQNIRGRAKKSRAVPETESRRPVLSI